MTTQNFNSGARINNSIVSTATSGINNSFTVAYQVNGQIYNQNVFASNSSDAVNKVNNIAMGKFGRNNPITLVSVHQFYPCGGTPVVVYTTQNPQPISTFVKTNGASM